MDGKLKKEQSFCIYCKKAISDENNEEESKNYHNSCKESIDEYNEQYKVLKKKFMKLQEELPEINEQMTFATTLDPEESNVLEIFDEYIEELPESIDCIQYLEEIWLVNNRIHDLPSTLANLSRLRVVDIEGNGLTKIPDVLFKCKNLTDLYLDYNGITSIPDKFTNLTKLRYLDISHTFLREIPEFIVNLENLRSLDISYTQIHNLPDFTKSKITNLTMKGIKLASIDSLPPNIFDLRLGFNSFSAFPKLLLQQHQPHLLALNDNPIKSIPGEYFSNYHKERPLHIDFGNCSIKSLPESICDVNIAYLNVEKNFITTLPKHMGEDKSVRKLNVSNNPIKELPEHISKDIIELYINNTKIDFIPKLYHVKKLSLRNTPITEFPDISKIKKLDLLDINNTNIESIPEYVKNIPIGNLYFSKKENITRDCFCPY